MTPEQRLSFLIGAVERFLEAPGCNNNSKKTALAKWAWALDEAKSHECTGDHSTETPGPPAD